MTADEKCGFVSTRSVIVTVIMVKIKTKYRDTVIINGIREAIRLVIPIGPSFFR